MLAGYEALSGMDIIHDHTVIGPLVAASGQRSIPPVLVTHHSPFTQAARRVLAGSGRVASIVAISNAHARDAAPVPIRAVIHHGLDLQQYRPGPGDGGYLAFIGRMCADKGVDAAVRVAKRAGLPLVIASKMRTPAEQAYFRDEVAPLLDSQDSIPQELPLEARVRLLQRATALVNPIRWPEPFGLVMIEALAAGTPVIARHRGAAPEIVEHRRTGFLCATEDEMVASIARIGLIDRHACRTVAEQRFGADRMAAQYEALYRRIIADAHCGPVTRVRSEPARRHAVDVTG